LADVNFELKILFYIIIVFASSLKQRFLIRKGNTTRTNTLYIFVKKKGYCERHKL